MNAALPLFAAISLAGCHAEPAPLITVSETKVVALPSTVAVYFTLANSGGRDRLLAVEAPGFGKAGLHETKMEGGIMRMRTLVKGIEVPSRSRVLLSPSGRHVMIERLARPLATGSRLSLTLWFERQGAVTIHPLVGGPR